ncbi:helix-turn-helix domain-containing protein [uncultured Roseobacter sp.]|uniref:helix-turn-helix domain-containing protein n=1 Tax=uncultured Roseobacter sp. TaxID=114847 RepID=UPI00260C72EC|nr:helix-turn-helix domain-containing protein [uncultured Roseobacter sp.]
MTEYLHINNGDDRYHYTGSGLDNIWLVGGVEYHETTYGPATSIHDVDDLHRAIAMDIISSASMTGKEFRFLRIELDLSQKVLAQLIKATEQQIHRWENGKSEIPGPAQVALSGYYLESVDPNGRMKELLDRISMLDKDIDDHESRSFALDHDKWTVAA